MCGKKNEIKPEKKSVSKGWEAIAGKEETPDAKDTGKTDLVLNIVKITLMVIMILILTYISINI